jgi:hypothetical protein
VATELKEAESHAVLNALTEHDFQDAIKNGRMAGNGAFAQNGTILREMLFSKHEVGYLQVSAPILENMDYFLLLIYIKT